MGRLIYSGITSLDGYTADAAGDFDWATPDDEVHAFINALERKIGTYLYGRRMYETMAFWETARELVDPPDVVREYTDIWQAAEKVVYSHNLAAATTMRTRIERSFDAAEVRRLVSESRLSVSVGGPGLAAHALKAGIVDEIHRFVTPIIVGGGTRFLPEHLRMPLELRGERRFRNGMVYLRYVVPQTGSARPAA